MLAHAAPLASVVGGLWQTPPDTLTPMDRPPPDPAKLLAFWMEWERGDATPGTVLKNLKNGGLRDILEAMDSTPSA